MAKTNIHTYLPSNVTEALFTGSRVYGDPTKDSDVDLVLFTGEDDGAIHEVLAAVCDDAVASLDVDGYPTTCYYFGKLNLITVRTARELGVWSKGTEDLAKRKPVSRKFAIAHLNKLRKKKGGTS